MNPTYILDLGPDEIGGGIGQRVEWFDGRLHNLLSVLSPLHHWSLVLRIDLEEERAEEVRVHTEQLQILSQLIMYFKFHDSLMTNLLHFSL